MILQPRTTEISFMTSSSPRTILNIHSPLFGDSDVTFLILLTSLSVNVCVVIWAGAVWIQRQRSSARRNSCQAERSDGKANTRLAESIADVILSILCIACGLHILISPVTWRNPFVSFSTDISTDENNDTSRGLNGPLASIALALGRFLFALLLLAYRGTTDGLSATLKFRCVYVAATLASFVIVVAYDENVLLAGCVLLLEIDSGIEGIYQFIKISSQTSSKEVVESQTTVSSEKSKKFRTLTVLVCITGCALCLLSRLIFIASVINSVRNYDPIAMSAVSLGLFGFALLFYVVFAAIVVKRFTERLRKEITTRSSAVPKVGKNPPSLCSYLLAGRLAMYWVRDKWVAGNGVNFVKDRRKRLLAGGLSKTMYTLRPQMITSKPHQAPSVDMPTTATTIVNTPLSIVTTV